MNDVRNLIDESVQLLISKCMEREIIITTAESCTGGMISQYITSVSGSSSVFEYGFVVYSNEAKKKILGVSNEILLSYGAVSEYTVKEMVKGALEYSQADLAVAVSGIAGPKSDDTNKPVGMVCISTSYKNQDSLTQTFFFDGDRKAVRLQTVLAAIKLMLEIIEKNKWLTLLKI